ncbi:MAG: hypothetical protein GC182_09360 [Rhodopseudomonas sp.]|nr:hypothetical protein [Rhodopseudomonas sp.]
MRGVTTTLCVGLTLVGALGLATGVNAKPAKPGLVGRTLMFFDGRHIPYYITYQADGACQARSDRGTASGCRWYLEGGKVCHQYLNRTWVQTMDCRPIR